MQKAGQMIRKSEPTADTRGSRREWTLASSTYPIVLLQAAAMVGGHESVCASAKNRQRETLSCPRSIYRRNTHQPACVGVDQLTISCGDTAFTANSQALPLLFSIEHMSKNKAAPLYRQQ